MDALHSTNIAATLLRPDAATAPKTEVSPEGATPQGASFREVLEARSEPSEPSKAKPVEATGAPELHEARERLNRFVDDVLRDEKKLDRIMHRAARGADMSNAELLRLQGLVYSYAQRVDLATKIVEKTTGGLKQMMNTQV